MAKSRARNMRADFEEAFGRSLTDDQWRVIVERGYLGDVEAGAETVPQVVQRIRAESRDLLRVLTTPTHSSMDRQRPAGNVIGARIDALSAVYTAWASREPTVIDFRRRHLDDASAQPQLIAGRDVRDWIFARHDREAVLAFPERDTTLLSFIHRDREQRLTVVSDGPLGELAALAHELAERYRWAPSGASLFVLTGRVCEVFVYEGSVAVRAGRISATTRVTMTLDPYLTPAQVAGIYSRLRDRLAPDGPPRSPGLRRYLLAGHVGPHVDIARELVAERTGPGRRPRPDETGLATVVIPTNGHTWQTLRTSWNERYGTRTDDAGRSLAYSSASNFTTHAQEAVLHLLLPPWQWSR